MKLLHLMFNGIPIATGDVIGIMVALVDQCNLFNHNLSDYEISDIYPWEDEYEERIHRN